MNFAVIFAGGVGTRMKTGGLPKQLLEVNDKPIIIHTLQHFEDHPEIDHIVLVMADGWLDYTQELLDKYGITKVSSLITGGATGQESIYKGLCEARDIAGDAATGAIVLVHDGVRPVIDADLITANIRGVQRKGSAITCVPCKETVVMVTEGEERVDRIVERSRTRIARAPQSFFLADILAGHEKALAAGETNMIDSCTLMQFFGDITPCMIEGSYENIKITTPEDYYTLKTLLDLKAGKLEEV